MVDDDVARQAREQRGELGLALGRPAVEQLGQALATRGHEPVERLAAGGAEHDRPRRARRRSRARAARPMRAATRAGSTEWPVGDREGVRRLALADAREDPALARGELDAGLRHRRSRIRWRRVARAPASRARARSPAAGRACLGAAKASPTPVASTVRRSGFSGSSQARTKATRRDRRADEEDRRQRVGVGADEGRLRAGGSWATLSRVTRPTPRRAAGPRIRRARAAEAVGEDRAADGHAEAAADRAEEGRARGRDAEVAVVDVVLDGEHEHLHHEAEPEAEDEHVERRARAAVVVGPIVESSQKPTTRIAVPAIGNGL